MFIFLTFLFVSLLRFIIAISGLFTRLYSVFVRRIRPPPPARAGPDAGRQMPGGQTSGQQVAGEDNNDVS